MGRELIFLRMGINLQVSMLRGSRKELVLISGRMELFIQVSLEVGRRRGKASGESLRNRGLIPMKGSLRLI